VGTTNGGTFSFQPGLRRTCPARPGTGGANLDTAPDAYESSNVYTDPFRHPYTGIYTNADPHQHTNGYEYTRPSNCYGYSCTTDPHEYAPTSPAYGNSHPYPGASTRRADQHASATILLAH
jgi:hypothetical protein